MKKDLVQIIKDNPGCVAIIDNDSWSLHKEHPYDNDNADDDDWQEANRLCDYEDIETLGDGGYGSGNCYGGDILQALAIICGINVESV